MFFFLPTYFLLGNILEAAVSFKMSFKNDELTLAAILENKEGSGGEKILVFPQGNGSLNVFFNLKATLIVGIHCIHTHLHIGSGWLA